VIHSYLRYCHIGIHSYFRYLLIRSAALRAIQAYRMVSNEAALPSVSMPPADLLGLDWLRIKSQLGIASIPDAKLPSKKAMKTEECKATITMWQARWSASSKASWTRLAIPDVSRWFYERTVRKCLWHITWPKHWLATVASNNTCTRGVHSVWIPVLAVLVWTQEWSSGSPRPPPELIGSAKHRWRTGVRGSPRRSGTQGSPINILWYFILLYYLSVYLSILIEFE